MYFRRLAKSLLSRKWIFWGLLPLFCLFFYCKVRNTYHEKRNAIFECSNVVHTIYIDKKLDQCAIELSTGWPIAIEEELIESSRHLINVVYREKNVRQYFEHHRFPIVDVSGLRYRCDGVVPS